jgi:hypothetical protein
MNPQRVLQLSMMVVPVLGFAVGSQVGAGARRAAAAPQAEPPADVLPLPPERPRMDPVQTEAAVYARSLRETGGTTTPFYVVASESAQAVLESDRLEPEKVEPVPTFHLKSIMKGRDPVASINGRLRRVGDHVEGAWIVKEIDPQNGTVLLTAPGRDPVLVRLR